MDQEKIISRQSAEAFLIKDESLKSINASFYQWLRENGFSYAWRKGHYDVCDWCFVNITRKLFAYGTPGIGIVTPIGNHAITLDEFYQIYNIYEKYRGLEALVMPPKDDEKY